jgi:hypothetical protein
MWHLLSVGPGLHFAASRRVGWYVPSVGVYPAVFSERGLALSEGRYLPGGLRGFLVRRVV